VTGRDREPPIVPPEIEDPWISAADEEQSETEETFDPVWLATLPEPDPRTDPEGRDREERGFGEADLTADEIGRFQLTGSDAYDEIARLLRTAVQRELEGFVRLVMRGGGPR
jgi:hypothetical protein